MNLQKERVTVLARLYALPGYEKVLMEEAGILAEKTRKEVGCEMFVINVQKDEPKNFVFYEVFSTDQDRITHLSCDYTIKFLEFVKGKVKGDASEVTFLSEIISE